MLRLFTILAFSAFVFTPIGVKASEDMEMFDFGQEEIEEISFTDDFYMPETEISQTDIDIPKNAPDIETVPISKTNTLPVPYTSDKNDEEIKIVSPTNPPEMPKVDTNAPLTDNLKRDDAEQPQSPLNNVKNTWIGNLVSSQTKPNLPGNEELTQLLEGARENAPKNKRSNASVFDISGVMLRMSLEQADRALTNRGYKKVVSKYQIPNFIKWRNEEHCRNSGVVGYERIESCIAQKAKKENHQYVQTAKYAKYDTKEEVEITLTSNFTANRVIKVEYKSQAANKSGNSPKSVYLRNIKIYDFWKTVNQKYGEPDDKEAVIWGMGGNKPFLKAATGYLRLEDPMLKELDYTRMSREDQRYMNTDLYSF